MRYQLNAVPGVAEVATLRIHQYGQGESGRQTGDGETGDREACELRQSDDSGKQECDIRDAGACHTGRERRPQLASGFDGGSRRVPVAHK